MPLGKPIEEPIGGGVIKQAEVIEASADLKQLNITVQPPSVTSGMTRVEANARLVSAQEEVERMEALIAMMDAEGIE